MICRHCGVRKANRPLGLCWRDYYTPGVRRLYGWRPHPVNRRGVGDSEPTGACQPTQALPGSAEKKRVLEQRAIDGQPLWHEDDPTCPTTYQRERVREKS